MSHHVSFLGGMQMIIAFIHLDFICQDVKDSYPFNSFWAIYEITQNSEPSQYSLHQFGRSFTVISVFVMIHYFFLLPCNNCIVTAVIQKKMTGQVCHIFCLSFVYF